MLELAPIPPCFQCGHDSDMNVLLDGRNEAICSVCWERADMETDSEGENDAGT